ncbi:MAG: N-acetyl sugar amidotransferase [Microgenomates group bacterium]
MNKNSNICNKCVLDNSMLRTNLNFDKNHICQNCRNYEELAKKTILRPKNEKNKVLEQKIAEIKKWGKGRKYDCLLGLSGGADSSYLALIVKKYGLRPLVVHFDNGWNSELAVSNIHNIVTKLGFDLQTYVIEWEEYKDIQRAYIKSSVIDIEVPCDHFVYATIQMIAHKYKIKYVLDGNNIASEYWGGSWRWTFNKSDLVNLVNIHKKFGEHRLNKYPKLGFFQRYYYQNFDGIKTVYLLNYVPYVKKAAIKLLKDKLGWVDYGGKHYESIFTRFYQGYILPKKFGVDKRRVHYSNLIWSGQLSREDAIKELKKPTYPVDIQKSDKEYVLKKLDFSEDEFDRLMKQPEIPHEFYGTESDNKMWYWLFTVFMAPVIRIVKLFR